MKWFFASLAKLEVKLHDSRKENNRLKDDLSNKILEIKNLSNDMSIKIEEIKRLNVLLGNNNLDALNDVVDQKMFSMKIFNDKLGDRITQFNEIDIKLKDRYKDFQSFNDNMVDKFFLCHECKEMKGSRKFWFGF